MQSKRFKRIEDFKNFYDHSKEIFENYAKNDSHSKRLQRLYSFCLSPGGREGGWKDKEIEIFFGRRPIGKTTELDADSLPKTRYEMAHGATLFYSRTDDGHVICNLYPAGSENQKPPEQFILLDYIKDPSKLQKKSTFHWKMFIAYMECTCIDGDPNILHRLRHFYLKNCKEYVLDNIVQPTKVSNLIKDISKYVLTVGLSGFLILVFTLIKDNIDDSKERDNNSEIYDLLNQIHVTSSNVSSLITQSQSTFEAILNTNTEQAIGINELQKRVKESNQLLSQSTTKLQEIEESFQKMNLDINNTTNNLSNKPKETNQKPAAAF